MIQSHIEFLKRNGACRDGVKWASENCETLQDAWDKAKPEWVVWLATQPGVLTERELHEFGLWCAEQVRHLMTDPRSIAALDAKRAWLDGEISDEQLKEVKRAAQTALLELAIDAPTSAFWAADAALSAAVIGLDAILVRLATEYITECVVEAMYERDSIYAAQAAWLRKNIKPKFPEAL